MYYVCEYVYVCGVCVYMYVCGGCTCIYVMCVCVCVLVIISFLKGTRIVQIQEEESFNIQLLSFPRLAICSMILAFSVRGQQSQLAAHHRTTIAYN